MLDIDKNVVNEQYHSKNFSLYNADSVEVMANMPDNSIDYSIFSPPFNDLFVYNDSKNDVGNNQSYEEFFEHYQFIIKELYRVIKPGRLVSIHCMNLTRSKQKDGFIGLRDFRGDNIRAFEKEGFIYHSEVCIWKDPLIAAVRTKALGLLHKQLCKDSSMCRQGLPDYIVTMKKPGENENLISHENGIHYYPGDDESKKFLLQYLKTNQSKLFDEYDINNYTLEHSHNVWRKIASPVWMDINQTRTLNYRIAKDKDDEKHLCPLQLDAIERCLILWSNKEDIVYSPFCGIGSEGYASLNLKRKFIGSELKESYYKKSVEFLSEIEQSSKNNLNDLF